MVDEKLTHNDNKFITLHPVAIAQILSELAKNKTTLNLSFDYGHD